MKAEDMGEVIYTFERIMGSVRKYKSSLSDPKAKAPE